MKALTVYLLITLAATGYIAGEAEDLQASLQDTMNQRVAQQ